MPTAVIDLPLVLDPPRKRWTRAEFEELSSSLLEGQRLELIEGELINKMGKNRPHAIGMIRLRNWLISVFGADQVETEASIDVAPEDNPTNAPEPDITVLKRDAADFPKQNPGPQDLHLVVEVADTTLGFDLRTKAALYARAGIADYWVLDVAGRRIIVHREPQAGRYGSVAAYGFEESVSPLAAPAASFRVRDAFPE